MQSIKPIDINDAGNAQAAVDAVKKQMGSVPNIFATMANSSSVLEGYLAFNGALSKGNLSPSLREQIALSVGGQNQCDYCASAHSFLAKRAGINQNEIHLNLEGRSQDLKTDAILKYVNQIVSNRGLVNPSATEAIRSTGVNDSELVEIIAHVGLNIFTNYFNHLAGTEIDFPEVSTKTT